jgi:hypothetical protein
VWDEGAIQTFMNDANVVIRAYDLEPHTLLLAARRDMNNGAAAIATEVAAEVAAETRDILKWLGTPRPFTVILWWRDDPRLVSANEWPSRQQVNGGWTVAGSSVICMYRQEEWQRVAIHEMIHALEWDWKMPNEPLPCWKLGPSAHLVPALFEAWTELLAEWLHCVWTSNADDRNGALWKDQRQWQDWQAAQILRRAGNQPWTENTSVFAYYILKAALAPHFPFLWMHGNGRDAVERDQVLCALVAPELERLRQQAVLTVPVTMSLRMSVPPHHSTM